MFTMINTLFQLKSLGVWALADFIVLFKFAHAMLYCGVLVPKALLYPSGIFWVVPLIKTLLMLFYPFSCVSFIELYLFKCDEPTYNAATI